jgi:hypothetical protein
MDGLHYGSVELGGNLYGHVPTLNAGVPTDADSQPTYTIFGPSGAMTGGTGTTASISAQTGLYDFTHAITSGNGYASGVTYFVRADWEFSTVAHSFYATFSVT